MTTIPSENHKDEITHLADKHGLIKTTAFIRSNSSKQRSTGAERVAKHRQQKKGKGIVQVDVPISVAKKIKAAGSFETWSKQFSWVPVENVKIINQAIATARKVYRLPWWVRWVLGL